MSPELIALLMGMMEIRSALDDLEYNGLQFLNGEITAQQLKDAVTTKKQELKTLVQDLQGLF